MNVIEVIPIARTIGTETLSYFTGEDIPLGALVKVPLRKKKINGIVVASHTVSDIKSQVKTADFSMRKIEELTSTSFLSPEFMRAVQKTAAYFAAPIGSILTQTVASNLFSYPDKLVPKLPTPSVYTPMERFVVQGDDLERSSHHKSLIRQEFARKRSVVILVPTVEDGNYMHKLIEKGIEEYTVFLHSGISKKGLKETLHKIQNETHPMVIFVTGPFLALPRPDIATIIIERENAKGYRTPKRPYIDYRIFAEFLAKESNSHLYVGDILLRTETLERQSHGDFVESPPFKWRSLSTAEDTLVDMRPDRNADKASQKFQIFSPLAEEIIHKNRSQSEHMAIYATRRGVAPMTVCGDCQNIVTCRKCSSPVVLHEPKAKASGESLPFFLCHRCGDRRGADETCSVCDSWKLGTVGIGIDLIAKKLRDKFSDIKLYIVDADATKTEKEIRETIAKWRAAPGSILLGTDMMLSYLHEPIHNVLVVSLDSLFSLPDFRIQEKIVYTLTKLRTLASRTFVLQTRKAQEKILEYAMKGNLADFHRHHVAERKQFNYPPFAVLIKITLEGNRDQIVKEMESLQSFLAPHDIEVFPAFTHTVKGNFVLHGLIRIPRNEWPNEELVTKLQSLPPYVALRVDPESLL